ncbi:MAG: hypothetical protein ABFD64_06280 [Armatimonadota bacterium]
MSNFCGPHGRPDDLLSPTLGDQQLQPAGRKPWQPTSLLYVAFFGGALAYTVIALINGRRIGLSKDKQNLIMLLGFIGLVASFIMHYFFPVIDGNFTLHTENKLSIRLGDRIIGTALYLICSSFMNEANRIYQYRCKTGYESLLGTGIAAVVGLGSAQLIIIYGTMFITGIL